MRLFIAINFPEAMRERLWAAASPLRDRGLPVRWVAAPAMHLTVKFLGEVEEERRPGIQDRLAHALQDIRAFHLPIGGFGAFPTAKHPRVLWVGCEGLPALEVLNDAVEREMVGVGFPVEGRPFRPHVTIGRATRGARRPDFRGLKRDLEALDFEEEAHITAVDLMLSHLSRPGPRYERLQSVGLLA